MSLTSYSLLRGKEKDPSTIHRKYYPNGRILTDPYFEGIHAPYPYTYSYNVPSLRYARSLYGRGAMSEYGLRPTDHDGYRSPYAYRTELFGSRFLPYLTDTELDYYHYNHHPMFSRYSRHCKSKETIAIPLQISVAVFSIEFMSISLLKITFCILVMICIELQEK